MGDDLPCPFQADGQDRLVAFGHPEAVTAGAQDAAGFGDVDGALQRCGELVPACAGVRGGDRAEELHALVEGEDLGLVGVQAQFQFFERLYGQGEGGLPGPAVGYGDREVVAVAQHAVSGAQQRAVERVEVEVGQDGRQGTVLVKAPAGADALGRRTHAAAVDQVTDQEAQVAVREVGAQTLQNRPARDFLEAVRDVGAHDPRAAVVARRRARARHP